MLFIDIQNVQTMPELELMSNEIRFNILKLVVWRVYLSAYCIDIFISFAPSLSIILLLTVQLGGNRG